jgi:hypothetical protein
MSDLLNSASLVLIPSGYKEDIVYSAVPTDGSGDLSFTRASNGTRVNSAGLVEVVAWNMLSNSEQFTSGNGWFANVTGSSTASQTSDYGIAPNGTTTADRIQLALNGSSFADWVVVPTTGIIVGQVYTYSIYIKSLSGTKTIKIFNDSAVNVVKTITTEWARLEYTWTASSSTIYPRFLIDIDGATSTSADLLAWGFQINIGSTAKPYFPTTDRLNVPRLTYQNGGGGCPSLLLEKQSTNLAQYSEQFDNVAWDSAGGASVVANNAISPDGTQNADTSLTSATTGLRQFVGGITNGALCTLTLYVKQASSSSATHIRVTVNDTSSWTGAASAKVALTNQWQRVTLNWTATGTAAYFLIGSPDETGSSDTSCYGNAAIWGAQLEQSSYATSYIGPTTSASATRVADKAKAPQSTNANFGTGGFTVFMDVNYAKLNPDDTLALLGNRQSGNWYRVYGQFGVIRLEVQGSNGYANPLIINSAEITTRTKIAFSRNGNNMKVYVNGSSVLDVTNVIYSSDFTTGNTWVEFNTWDGGNSLTTTEYNETVFFKQSLTATELASLTTL